MNIAENILKHSLKNVFFLTGTAMAGKTTIAQELSKKYGFVHFNDNWHEDNFKIWESIIDDRYQMRASKRKAVTDWEAYFGRTVEDFLADGDYNGYDEYLEYAIIELIKLSQYNVVVADVSMPLNLLVEISDYNRIACMIVSHELATCENYGSREDHKEFLECIMSLEEPEKKIAVQDELFRINIEKALEEVRKYSLFYHVRTEDSTVKNTLSIIEEHFGLCR